MALTTMSVPLYSALLAKHSVMAAADAAALAGADVAVGIVAGFPCEKAGVVASANGALLTECETDGLIVSVVTSRILWGWEVTATATAGPPPGEAD